MPVYEYVCKKHGTFEALRPMESYADPCACPACGAQSARIMLTAPRLTARDRGQMRAHAVNERSASDPKRSSSHGAGCACCSPARKGGKASAGPEAAKGFPSRRPWMISH